ncbi:MAG: GAF domain-containing protein, partial [Bacteroidota bacterium]
AIQPFGLLVVVAESTFEILQISENAGSFTDVPAGELVHGPLGQLIQDESWLRTYQDWLSGTMLQRATPFLEPVDVGGSPHVVSSHRTGGGLVLEIEPVRSNPVHEEATSSSVETALDRLRSAETKDDLARIAAEEVRRLTGLDRVKIYQFDDNWNGSVVAEDRADFMPSYLGLQFPASDIPKQARKLYESNRIRMIQDVNYVPARVLPELNPTTNQPLVMSQCWLRSISPLHIEYLQNMGVQASVSMSVTVKDRLWGMIACHHAKPYHLSPATRAACTIVAQVLGLLVQAADEISVRKQLAESQSVHTQLLEHMMREPDFVRGLVDHTPNLLDVTHATGAVVVREGSMVRVGTTPDEDELSELHRWLSPKLKDDDVFDTAELSAVYAHGEAYQAHASGLLAISLSRLKQFYIVWFRPEIPRTVYWAGEQGKYIEQTANGEIRLSPRKSFAKWQEIKRGKAEPWSQQDLSAALHLRQTIVDIVFAKVEEVARLNMSLVAVNKELRKSRNQLRDLTVKLQRAREEERLSLSREVHDILGQALTSIRMELRQIDRGAQQVAPELQPRIASMDELVRSTIDTARRISHDLRPGMLDDLGLPATIEYELMKFQDRTDIVCTFETNDEDLQLAANHATTLYRVFQEIMTNVARHANATKVHASLNLKNNVVTLQVRDNGRGIRAEDLVNTKSLGLLSMRERLHPWNGTVEFDGVPDKGTKVTVKLHRGG